MLITFVKWIARIVLVTVFFTGSLIVSSVNVFAAKFDLEAGVYSELTWTDNVDIAIAKRDADTYLTVNPYLRMSRDSNRIKANMDYQAQATIYNQYSGRNDLQHLLRGDLQVEFIRDHFVTDFYIARESEVINADEAISFDGLFYGANTADKYTAQVSPKGVIPLVGDIAIDFFSSHGKVVYDQGIDDLEEHQAKIAIGTGTRSTGLNWGLNVSKQYVQTENQNSSQSEQIDLSGSFPVFNRLLVHAMFGQKREVLSSYVDREWDKGEIWEGKLIYAFSNKTKLEAGGGKDLYSHRAIASFMHATQRTSLQIDHIESQVTKLSNDIKEAREKTDPYKFGRAVDDIFIQKKSSINWKVLGAKNTINFYLGHEERFYRNIGVTEILLDSNLRWEYRLSGRSNLSATINWWRLGDKQEDRLDDMSLYTLKYQRNIGSKSHWYASAKAGIRDGTHAALEYKEFKLLLGAEFRY